MEATAMGLGIDLEGEEWQELKKLTAESFWVMRCAFPPAAREVRCRANEKGIGVLATPPSRPTRRESLVELIKVLSSLPSLGRAPLPFLR